MSKKASSAKCQEETAGEPASPITVVKTGDPLPRPVRRRSRRRKDRGLPDDDRLEQLANVYLEKQGRLFPTHLKSGHLDANNVAAMVQDFKARHGGQAPNSVRISALRETLGTLPLGAGYFRYSCDNSNPKSIEDQVVNCLDKAANDGRFIPWDFIYADYSVTGLDASRQGYTSLKARLKDANLDTVYVDDFTRASRDEVEWWRLANVVKQQRKCLIGASDNFTLDNSEWDINLFVFALLSRLFMKSLRQKVHRGMTGAARRATCLGKLPLGFTKRLKLGGSGNPLKGGDGKPIHEPCIDSETAELRLLMFKLFIHENWTTLRIARHFNSLQVDQWNGWTSGAISNLLWNPSSIGVFIWNKTHTQLDLETGGTVKVENPRPDWIVRYDHTLAIVPIELYRAARRKLAAIHRKYAPRHANRSRNQIAPTTLFSGALFCECCGEELKLIRSTTNYKQMGSIRGKTHAQGCKLSMSKSTRQIEECLLAHLRGHLLTDAFVEELVVRANQYLDLEATRPPVDVAPLVRRAAGLNKQIQRLVRRSAETEDDGVAASFSVEIKRLRSELSEIQPQIRKAESAEHQRSERLDVEQAKLLLADLRGLLNQDVAIAGPLIQELMGPISIRQEPIDSQSKRCRWIASFQPHLGVLLKKVIPQGCGHLVPSTSAVPSHRVEVIIDRNPQYELLAVEFQRMHAAGMSMNAIETATGHNYVTVTNALSSTLAVRVPA